jgi:anti-sigma28 factor (negative regulator of flagellin synthesis)
MNRANAMEGFARERRGLSPVIAVRRSVAEAIAEDPAKLCLAGRLISWATAGNEARFELVASLRQAIEAGTYGVAACDAADKLMEGMRR